MAGLGSSIDFGAPQSYIFFLVQLLNVWKSSRYGIDRKEKWDGLFTGSSKNCFHNFIMHSFMAKDGLKARPLPNPNLWKLLFEHYLLDGYSRTQICSPTTKTINFAVLNTNNTTWINTNNTTLVNTNSTTWINTNKTGIHILM